MILLISASQVARIRGMSYQCPAVFNDKVKAISSWLAGILPTKEISKLKDVPKQAGHR
jgi:hypothetical protein